VPPPPPAEIVYVDRPVLVFNDPAFDFVPPPPIVFLAPPPPYLVYVPPPPLELFVLPVPVFVPVPIWVNPPPYVVPPPEAIIFNNTHNTTIINNNRTVINPGSPRVALPPSVARRATLFGSPSPPGLNPGQASPGAPLNPPGAAAGRRGWQAVARVRAKAKAPTAITGGPRNPPGIPPKNPPAPDALPSGPHRPPPPPQQTYWPPPPPQQTYRPPPPPQQTYRPPPQQQRNCGLPGPCPR
jgi:hypothetical protein